MKRIMLSLFIFLLAHAAIAQSLYLKKNSNGHLKKLKHKTILSFQLANSTWITGRIVAVNGDSFTVARKEKFSPADTVAIPIRSVMQIQNPLMNDNALAEAGGWIIVGGALGVALIPVAWIDDGPHAAGQTAQAVGGILCAGGTLFAPYLIKKKYNTQKKWQVVVR